MGFENFRPSENSRLNAQLKFTAEIDKMTAVLRRTLLVDGNRQENDAEHSWHIGVMAMLFAEYAVETPDTSHAVEMALVHDLVEIYAGDTFAYDVQGNATKKARELEAADKLMGILPEEQGAYIRALWEEFDACETVDAKYANCLDRLQPFYQNTLTEGHTWKHSNPRTMRYQVEERMGLLQEFMPEVYAWVSENLDYAVEQGWLLE